MAAHGLTQIERVKGIMLMKHVFFASVLLSTPLIESAEQAGDTACTDMRSIWFNPVFMATLDDRTALFVLAHETAHIVLKHGLRRGRRHPKIWNKAADYAINLWLQDCGFSVWKDALIESSYRGLPAEEIYELIIDDLKNKRGKHYSKDGEPISIPGCGDVSVGYADGLGDDLVPMPPMSDAEAAKIGQQITQKIAAAATMQRQSGKMPAGLERVIGPLLDPQVPWNELFAAYANKVVFASESWSRRNRRFAEILPGRHSLAMGELVVINDSSGSIRDAEIGVIASELNAIRETVNPERMRVIWADDCECSHEEVFEQNEPLELHPKGGGGTDMRKPLKFVEQYEPIITVLITDGHTPWPAIAPPFPLIVCCTTDEPVPDYAEVVRLRA